MAITDKILISTEGAFDIDEREVTLEWLVLSDNILDFSRSIAVQGTVDSTASLIGANGEALGWHPPGTPYRLGNDFRDDCFAGKIEVTGREIIGGEGDFEILPGITIVLRGNGNPTIKWRVKQRYSTINEETAEEYREPSENDPFTVSVFYEWEELPFTVDVVTGKRVVNSAGQPFNPPTARKQKIPVISLTRREFGNPVAKAIAYSNGIDGQYLIDSIVPQFNGKFWTVTYNIKVKPEGWATYLLDTGYYGMHPSTGKPMPICGQDGLPVSEPDLLDGRGHAMQHRMEFPEAFSHLPAVNRDAVFNVGPFYKYKMISIAALKIPDPCLIGGVDG